MQSPIAPRSASLSAWLAIPSLLLSALFLVLFFGGKGAGYGSLNDLFVAVVAVLLALPARALVAAVGDAAGRWFDIVSWFAVAGLLLIAVGQLLLIARVISLGGSFTTGGLGILPVLVWLVAQVVVALRTGRPSRALGWAGVAVLATSVLASVAPALRSDAATWATTVLLLVSLVAWLWVLGRDVAEPVEVTRAATA